MSQWAALKELGELVLIDIEATGPAEGRGLDLDAVRPVGGLRQRRTATSPADKPEAMAGADVVVMTAGVPRKPGQSREELININAGIVHDICGNVKKHAPDAILIVVSNPLDAMVFVAKQVTGFPRERVIGSAGMLDSARFRTYLAMAASVSVEDVQAIVLGAHTDKRHGADVSTAMIGNVPVTKYLSAEKLNEVVENTKKGGATLTGPDRHERVARAGAGTGADGRGDRARPGPRLAVLGGAAGRVWRQGRLRRRAGEAHGRRAPRRSTRSSWRPTRRRRSASRWPPTPS